MAGEKPQKLALQKLSYNRIMEAPIHRYSKPDAAMRRRTAKAGAVGVGALATMGVYSAAQIAAAEQQPAVAKQVISAEDLHGVRPAHQNDVRIQQEKSAEIEKQNLEPAQWWPVGVKENWLQIQITTQQYQLDPYLVATIIAEESGGQNVQNASGAKGLMQIMPTTAQEIARLRRRAYYDMNDSVQNLDYGCWLIQYIDQNYISSKGVDLKSDLGIEMLAVYYGDGVGAGELWAKNNYQPKLLSDQAKIVAPLWVEMFRNAHSEHSPMFEKARN